MTDEVKSNEDTASQTKPVNHILTILVDLSNPVFAGRGIHARIALAETLNGLARAALKGAEATLVSDAHLKPVGIYVIAPDDTGMGREAFDVAVQAITGSMRPMGEADVVPIPNG